MNQRGVYGQSAWRHNGQSDRGWCTYLGADPSDADRAFIQIDVEMEAIVDAIYRAMGVDPATLRKPTIADAAWQQRVLAAKTKAQQSPLWSFWESSVSPKYEDWRSVRVTFLTSPMPLVEYDRWFDRVKQLHAEVKAEGINLKTPDPVSLSRLAGGGMDSSKIVKWAAIGGAAILGVVAVVALSSSTKQARAPYERYRYGYFATR
jgi:hypothetical protein